MSRRKPSVARGFCTGSWAGQPSGHAGVPGGPQEQGGAQHRGTEALDSGTRLDAGSARLPAGAGAWSPLSGCSPRTSQEATQGGPGLPCPPQASSCRTDSRCSCQQTAWGAGCCAVGEQASGQAPRLHSPPGPVVAAAPIPSPCPPTAALSPSSSQTFPFHFYGLILRECASVDLVKRHLASLLELCHQSSSQREVGQRASGHSSAWGLHGPSGSPQPTSRRPCFSLADDSPTLHVT